MSKALALRAIVGGASLGYNLLRSRFSGSTPVPMSKPPARRMPMRSAPRRSYRRKTYVPRNVSSTHLIRRTTQFADLSLAAGFVNGSQDINLGAFYTADLVNVYDQFRIKSCTVEFLPQVDLGNNGISLNSCLHCYTACDTIATITTPATAGIVTGFNNYKYGSVASGGKYLYTFYPKVVNTVDNAGTAVAAGSYQTNPWLSLNANGLTIPHHRLVYFILNGGASTQKLGVTYTITFEVKRMR